MSAFNKKIVIAAMAIANGGLGSYLMNVAEELKTRGWLVHIVATNGRDDLFDVMSKAFPCHDLSTLPLSLQKVIVASNLVNEIAPDVLLLNHCALMHYALPLLSSRTKPVAVLHSDDKRFYKTVSLFEKRIFRWIAPTRGVAERCKPYLQQEQRERVRIIPHGIDNELFTVNKSSRGKISGNICFVGFIAENKGADLLPDIFNRVSKEYKDARLTIVGQGPLEQTLKEMCGANGTLNKVSFRGAANRKEIAAILRNSDILILPTRIEGFGLSVVEAMMSGVVPVVSRIQGITDDIVADGITGLLIEPDDTKGFADAIVSLLKNPEKLVLMSEAARETAVHRYSAERMLDAYEALFDEDDDRERMPCRGTMGWIKETISEVIKKGIDRQWLVNRAKEIWK